MVQWHLYVLSHHWVWRSLPFPMRAEWPALKGRCVSAVVPFCQSNMVFVSLALKIHFSVLHRLASVLLPVPQFRGPFCCLLLWSWAWLLFLVQVLVSGKLRSAKEWECLFRRNLLPVCRVSFLLWQRQQRCCYSPRKSLQMSDPSKLLLISHVLLAAWFGWSQLSSELRV